MSSLIATNPIAVRNLFRGISLHENATIVELGIARGTVTRNILRLLAKQDTKVIAIEIHKPFADHARQHVKDDRLEVIHGNAHDIGQIMQERRLQAQLVISGIPHSRIPREDMLQTMSVIRDSVLEIGGQYLIYNFTRDAGNMQKETFGSGAVDQRYDLLNFFPPLQISIATRLPRVRSFEECPDRSPQRSARSEEQSPNRGFVPPMQHLGASA